jgi:hypothetical protein
MLLRLYDSHGYGSLYHGDGASDSHTDSLAVASASNLIGAASNNVVKGTYAYTMADRKTGTKSLCLLMGLAALGLVPLLWLSV